MNTTQKAIEMAKNSATGIIHEPTGDPQTRYFFSSEDLERIITNTVKMVEKATQECERHEKDNKETILSSIAPNDNMLEKILERAKEKLDNAEISELLSENTYKALYKLQDQIVTEVWNEAIKECEGCVPKERTTNFIGYKHLNMRGRVWNDCRNQTLENIKRLKP